MISRPKDPTHASETPKFAIYNPKQDDELVYDQLYRYLTENKLLCCYQSDFRTIHSTVPALIEATDSWSLNVDRGFVNAVVFSDLKKALDTVNHANSSLKTSSVWYP